MADAHQPQVEPPIVLAVAGARAAVLNSLSPRMMHAAFIELNVEAWYVPLALRERSAAKALRALPRIGFAGCNVTMPFKRIAAEIAASQSEEVARLGVANTLVVRPDGTIHAEATDGQALVQALAARGISLADARVLVIGAGGVAAEAALACIDAGAAHIAFWNRTKARAELLVQQLHAIAPDRTLQVRDRMPIAEAFDVLLGCVPADVIDQRTFAALHPDTMVVDFAYRRDGRPSSIMTAIADQPERGIDGRELLVRQGAASLECWLGVEAPMKVMLDAVR